MLMVNRKIIHYYFSIMFFRVIIVALLSWTASAVVDLDDPIESARSYVSSLSEYEYEWKHECRYSDTESCNLSSFPKDETSMVFPGGETRCIFSNTPDFAFQVSVDYECQAVLYICLLCFADFVNHFFFYLGGAWRERQAFILLSRRWRLLG
jgi:hypothetical protein